ncbi:3-oxoacyl-[acyl-carrier protein] reductase [Bacillus sp. JCM 19046]|uniref:3-oxoacyl-[acyl-carrier protein] reductase n=2 Tax=Shouchella xiaoxiensis TaxID=766895 RepID=A0ABS2SSG0_9BACI|nr:3-oxoacyl-[acyl-carrier protein] reductase [Shouchella xiaoxiensis]GAF14954.1 3-oxoacyl-[acyl-carrier protein] reductase [Bacillus sp. JCM 19045]GAF15940.1 3-oxoacyl-[acyl-carrier protein] reductase [Bacillus sp. JCM 19046]
MRHALITAGTKGLGLKVTEALLKNGYSVTVTYYSDEKRAAELANQWDKNVLQLIKADVGNKADCEMLVKNALLFKGRIDLFIHNAGPYIFEKKKLVDYEDHEWNKMINGNLHSAYYLLKQIVPAMRVQHFGRIVFYGFQGANNAPGWIYRSAYAAAKVGLVSLMKTISIEEAEYGITANMVCPGNIMGEMKEASIEEARHQTDNNTPIGRSGTGEDIARTVLFLSEDEADMVTGTVIEVTGGVDVIHRYR